jgi:hypothetical protein
MKMLNCLKCEDLLKITSVVKWKADGSTKVIGHQQFCSSMNCNFEGEIVKKN